MKLYAALDLSPGNKATAIVGDTCIVIERVFDFRTHQYYWFCSLIKQPDGNGGTTIYDSSWLLGDTLKEFGIDYIQDSVWEPLS